MSLGSRRLSGNPERYLYDRNYIVTGLTFGMDSDTLIKLTKTGAKEVVVSAAEIVIPPEVERETVAEGKDGGFPDAFKIERNLERSLLRVLQTPRTEEIEEIIAKLELKGGEADLVRLFKAAGLDAVVSDDQKFIDLAKELEIPFTTSSGLLVYAWKSGVIDRRECLKLVEKLKPMISEEEYQLCLFELEERG